MERRRLAHGSQMFQHRIFKIFNLQEVKHSGVLAVELRITKTGQGQIPDCRE
jgi:hypothetical protein